MREIKIIRKKRFSASLVSPYIVLDGKIVASIKNGEEISLMVDEETHEIFTLFDSKQGNLLKIEPGEQNIILYVLPGVMSPGFFLSTTEERIKTKKVVENVKEVEPIYEEQKKQTTSYVTAIILAMLLIIMSYIIYANGEATMLGLIVASIFSIAIGVLMVLGGFWFVVIPLPYIAIWKAGCLKPRQSTGRKATLGIFIFVSVALLFVSLFTL